MLKEVVIAVVPHPRFKGDWMVECRELLPNALWYKSRENAIYYDKLLGKENAGEIRVFEPWRQHTGLNTILSFVGPKSC